MTVFFYLTFTDEIMSFFQLAKHLPPRTIGYPWTLAFSTSKHGMSIKTLYRTMQGQDSPVLLVIKDSDGQVRLWLRRSLQTEISAGLNVFCTVR